MLCWIRPLPASGSPGTSTRRTGPSPGRPALGRSFSQELLAVQPGVEAVERDELAVGAALNDAAAVKHEDFVGMLKETEPATA